MNAPKAMLATLTERRFSSEIWLFERKLDGVRALSVRDGGAVEPWSRDEKVLRSLRERMAAAETGSSPFADRVREPEAHWVSPAASPAPPS